MAIPPNPAFRATLFSLVVLLWFGSLSGFCQSTLSRSSSFGILIGNSNFHALDLLLSPLNYRANNFSAELFYRHRKSPVLQEVSLVGSGGDINTVVPHFTLTGVRAGLSYSYLRQVSAIGSKESEHTFSVGGILRAFMNVEGSEEHDVVSWLMVYSVNLAVQGDFVFNSNHQLSWQIYLPLIAMVHRPPYARLNESLLESNNRFFMAISSYGNIAAITDYPMIGNVLTYRYTMFNRFHFLVKHSFEYHKYSSPDTIKMFFVNILVGVNWNL